MALLLAIETTTRNCSVALFRDNNLLQIIEQLTDKYLHAEQLNIFIESILIKSNNSLKELDAIVLSKGPGSYTGLRIGLSFAKGIAFSLNKPIIPINTIESLSCEINDLNYILAIHAYSDYYFIQEYRDAIKFGDPFFDKIKNINYSHNIYGYNLKDCESSINIIPSSIKIANIAYKNYDKYKCDNIKLIKPNYIKPIQFKNKF